MSLVNICLFTDRPTAATAWKMTTKDTTIGNLNRHNFDYLSE
jgi:hypothetical protein